MKEGPVNETTIKSALLNYLNDSTEVVAYGHAHLVFTPLNHADDDSVSVMVEEFGDAVRVTDRGLTSMRLRDSDVTLTTTRMTNAWRRAIGSRPFFDLGGHETELSVIGDRSELAELIWRVSCAAIRVDQLRLLGTAPRPASFASRVLGRIEKIVPFNVTVDPKMEVRLSSGRTRQVTAGIVPSGRDSSPLLVQAVGGSTREAREEAVERCYHLYGLAEAPPNHKIAVAVGSRELWDPSMIRELEGVAAVAFMDDSRAVDQLVTARLAVA